MRAAVALFAAAMLAGCGGASAPSVPVPSPQASLSPARTILISYGACRGRCPIFTVTVSVLGQGNFEGQNFTAVSGNRAFPVSREQYDAVVDALARFRPADDSQLEAYSNVNYRPQCDSYAVEQMPTRIVTWTGTDGKQQALVWDTGCDAARYDGLQSAIDKALAALPVGPWIAPKQD